MTVPPTQAMTRPITKLVRSAEGLFAPGTLGAFLLAGSSSQGWPAAFTLRLGQETLRVRRSALSLECQGCSSRSQEGADLYKLRVCLEFEVSLQGQLHVRHVEDLYPMSILEALHAALDLESAAARVQEASHLALRALDEDAPLEAFLASCIAPMRLYEPLLNALVPPAPSDSVGCWLHEHLRQVLLEAEGVLLRLRHEGRAIELQVQQLQVQRSLRTPNEVKLLGRVVAQDEHTGQLQGSWRQRCTLLAPSLRWDQRQVERDPRAVERAIDAWRAHLRHSLERALAEGQCPSTLGRHIEAHGLDGSLEAISADQHRP